MSAAKQRNTDTSRQVQIELGHLCIQLGRCQRMYTQKVTTTHVYMYMYIADLVVGTTGGEYCGFNPQFSCCVTTVIIGVLMSEQVWYLTSYLSFLSIHRLRFVIQYMYMYVYNGCCTSLLRSSLLVWRSNLLQMLPSVATNACWAASLGA